MVAFPLTFRKILQNFKVKQSIMILVAFPFKFRQTLHNSKVKHSPFTLYIQTNKGIWVKANCSYRESNHQYSNQELICP